MLAMWRIEPVTARLQRLPTSTMVPWAWPTVFPWLGSSRRQGGSSVEYSTVQYLGPGPGVGEGVASAASLQFSALLADCLCLRFVLYFEMRPAIICLLTDGTQGALSCISSLLKLLQLLIMKFKNL